MVNSPNREEKKRIALETIIFQYERDLEASQPVDVQFFASSAELTAEDFLREVEKSKK